MISKKTRCYAGFRSTLSILALVLTVSAMLTAAPAQTKLKQLSTDTFKNTAMQHATEVEPDTYSFGSMVCLRFPGRPPLCQRWRLRFRIRYFDRRWIVLETWLFARSDYLLQRWNVSSRE